MINEGDELLSGKFCIYPGRIPYDVSLTTSDILFGLSDASNKTVQEIISLNDVIGCHVLQDKSKGVSEAYLSIFSYPLKKKKIGSGFIRQRYCKTFSINSRKSYQENSLVAETWKMTIKRLIGGEKIRRKEDIENGALATRNLLVLINPFSGRKKADELYKERVLPIFNEAEIRHTVKRTEYSGHAKKIAKTINLEDWDGLVIISGDGLVHEVVNGFMDREDWRSAIDMPLGIIPGGSGNALAASIVYASTGQMLSSNLNMDSLFEVVKGKTRKVSLVAVESQAAQRFYSFLNFAWGFIADVDIESERYRALGPIRFTLGCMIRVANMRRYQGRISYLPASTNAYSFGSQSLSRGDSMTSQDRNSANEGNDISFGAKKGFLKRTKASESEDAINNDIDLVNAKPTDVSEEQEHVEAGSSILNMETEENSNSSIKRFDDGDNRYQKQERESTRHASNVSGDGPSIIELENKSNSSKKSSVVSIEHATPTAWNDSAILYHLRSSIAEDPPDDWVQLESEFIWVTSVYLSHLGNEMSGVPAAGLDEDIIYIYTLRHGISKTQLMNVLMGFEGGTQIERGGAFSSVIPCKAVRLEPFTFITGHMTVDGEVVPHCTIQASITPHKMTVMSSVESSS